MDVRLPETPAEMRVPHGAAEVRIPDQRWTARKRIRSLVRFIEGIPEDERRDLQDVLLTLEKYTR